MGESSSIRVRLRQFEKEDLPILRIFAGSGDIEDKLVHSSKENLPISSNNDSESGLDINVTVLSCSHL